MVQVFAWLAEMLTYRMAKVPELNYLKFLELLGIEELLDATRRGRSIYDV